MRANKNFVKVINCVNKLLFPRYLFPLREKKRGPGDNQVQRIKGVSRYQFHASKSPHSKGSDNFQFIECQIFEFLGNFILMIVTSLRFIGRKVPKNKAKVKIFVSHFSVQMPYKSISQSCSRCQISSVIIIIKHKNRTSVNREGCRVCIQPSSQEKIRAKNKVSLSRALRCPCCF